MAKQLTDDELNIRRKQRRRLIGSIALTLAVVVILPMVLDSEPKPSEPDIDLRIPDQDNAGEFVSSVTIPEESTLQQPVAPSEEDAVVTAPEKSAVTEEKPAANKTIKLQTAAPQLAKSKPSAQPVPTEEGYVAQVGAYSNANTAKQELAKLKTWGFKAYTEKAGDTVRVRVGPYTSREKAEKVAKMLEKHGLKPVILTAK